MFCGDFRATYLETSVFEPLPGISADSVATAAHTGFYTDVFTEAMAGNGAGATLQTWFLRKQSLRQELGLSLGGARVGRPDWGKGQGEGRGTSHLGWCTAPARSTAPRLLTRCWEEPRVELPRRQSGGRGSVAAFFVLPSTVLGVPWPWPPQAWQGHGLSPRGTHAPRFKRCSVSPKARRFRKSPRPRASPWLHQPFALGPSECESLEKLSAAWGNGKPHPVSLTSPGNRGRPAKP